MRFWTTAELHWRTATGMPVPPDVVEALGAGKKPPVGPLQGPAPSLRGVGRGRSFRCCR